MVLLLCGDIHQNPGPVDYQDRVMNALQSAVPIYGVKTPRIHTQGSSVGKRDLLPAKNGEEPTIQFLLEVVEILTNYVRKTFDRSTKVLDFHHPHQLLEGMEGFNLELSDQPESLEQILVDCRDTLKYGVRTGHPRFFNQLSSGLDIIGLAGEWLTSTANTNMVCLNAVAGGAVFVKAVSSDVSECCNHPAALQACEIAY
ncbi:glutamate decarboxylase 1 isoform X2 [Labeo rohita]|uniref:Glutamate decarboxylase 1 isoform X2 n=1 Tax=Labeo rohita TaxID=84645 RepID=A0A498L5E0_LABRO|nr:glutamate decarboxylase 1 isoform X2 [Labeo rohita]